MKRQTFLVLIFLAFVLSSCVTFFKPNVNYMKPAKLNIPQDIKTIAILASGDRRYRVEINDVLLDVFGNEAVKARYDLIDRQNLDKILNWVTDFIN